MKTRKKLIFCRLANSGGDGGDKDKYVPGTSKSKATAGQRKTTKLSVKHVGQSTMQRGSATKEYERLLEGTLRKSRGEEHPPGDN